MFRTGVFTILTSCFVISQSAHSQVPYMNNSELPSVQIPKSDHTVKGWFYKLEPVMDGCAELHEDEFIPGADTPVKHAGPFDPHYDFVRFVDGPEEERARTEILYTCPHVQNGVTSWSSGCRTDWAFKHWVMRLSGPLVGDFVPATEGNSDISSVVISRRLADALQKSELRGFGLGTTEVIDPPEGTPKNLAVLQFRGHFCQRQRAIVGAANACPLCGYEPLICSDCGAYPSRCPKCNGITDVLQKDHQGSGDKRFVRIPGVTNARVLDGRLWDGSDFIYGRYISRRALLFLQSIKASRYAAIPVELDLEGVDDKQLASLKAAACIDCKVQSADSSE